jgi:hypothetical protein
MARRSVVLVGHADTPADLRQRIAVTLERTPSSLGLVYAIADADRLRIPTPESPAPADALWRTTCCEFFVAPVGGDAYREFNFSPSGQWAVYDFAGYRMRSTGAPLSAAPTIQTQLIDVGLQVDVALPAAALPVGAAFDLGLSVVLESLDGRFGYHALTHAPGRPDFHWRGGFTLSVEGWS